MIDLTEARALAESARADSFAGLTAREQLPDLVEALCAMLGQPATEWAAKCLVGGGEGMVPRDDEQHARDFIADLPANVRHVWVVAHRTVHRHATSWVHDLADTEASRG